MVDEDEILRCAQDDNRGNKRMIMVDEDEILRCAQDDNRGNKRMIEGEDDNRGNRNRPVMLSEAALPHFHML
jgi:hypothetical protein